MTTKYPQILSGEFDERIEDYIVEAKAQILGANFCLVDLAGA
jgi:hypothetical protein